MYLVFIRLYTIAVYLADVSHYEKLGCFFQQKCDFMLAGLRYSRFEVYVPQGIYFRVLIYGDVSTAPENEFVRKLVITHRVTMVLLAVFIMMDLASRIIVRWVK